MDNDSLFECVRKQLARERKKIDWHQIKDGGNYVSIFTSKPMDEIYDVFEVIHPGLIACRVYVNKEESMQAKCEKRQVKKNKLIVKVALSKDLTNNEYRIFSRLSRYGGRCSIEVHKLLPLGYTQTYSDGSSPKVEDIVDDFRTIFPKVSRSFVGLEAHVAQPFRNLVNLAPQEHKFGHKIWSSSTRRYNHYTEGEFIFLNGPLDYMY